MKQEEIIFCKERGYTARPRLRVFARVLDRLPKTYDPDLLIGYEGAGDVAIYKLTDDLAIVQTLNFFLPMVEDPYILGQIVAANVLSDIYVMGGDVKIALNTMCFPGTMDLSILGKILLGGSKKVREAGGVPAGGHSIADADAKYGLSATETIHPDKVFANNGCRERDVPLLTKPLGVGVAYMASRAEEETGTAMDLAVRSVTSPSGYVLEVAKKYRVHGYTDAIGSGFLGHLHEELGDSCTVLIHKDRIPFVPGYKACVERFYTTAAGQKNRNHIGVKVGFVDCSFTLEEVLHDPQTSGSPLISMERQSADRVLRELRGLGLPCGVVEEIQVRGEKAMAVNQAVTMGLQNQRRKGSSHELIRGRTADSRRRRKGIRN